MDRLMQRPFIDEHALWDAFQCAYISRKALLWSLDKYIIQHSVFLLVEDIFSPEILIDHEAIIPVSCSRRAIGGAPTITWAPNQRDGD